MQVQTWLEGLFGEGNVPEYEIRADTLDALQRLRERHERSCRVTSELLEDAKRKKQEYECEGTFRFIISTDSPPSPSRGSKHSYL